MIKTLIGKIETAKEIHLIKKHFRIAKKHQSYSELNKVRFEVLDLQGKLILEDKYSENINSEIFHLLADIDSYQSNHIPVKDFEW